MAKASNVALQAMYAGLGNPGDPAPAAKSEDSKWTIWEIGALIIAGGAAAKLAKDLLTKDAGGQRPEQKGRREFLKRAGGGVIGGPVAVKEALKEVLDDGGIVDMDEWFPTEPGISKAEATNNRGR